jgi:predicted nucleic acid-binding protein
LDTCVWCRIFDDQTQIRIAEETMAFISILELAEIGEVSIVNSDVLEDEIEEILSQEKRSEIQMLMTLSDNFVELSDDIIEIAKELQKNCKLSGGDALHLACACNSSQFFLTCDDFILEKIKCIEEMMKKKGNILKVENPIDFIEEKHES